MQAFHNDQKTKDKYLSRVKAHELADEIIQGTYWENGKGCAVGCTIHGDQHKDYETELGIPRWLARLEDRIFEGLPNQRAKKWPAEFLEAINVGSDLSKVLRPMLIFIVESARENTKNERSLSAIDGVLVELRKETLDLPALKKARDAAYAAYADAAYADADAAYAADAAAYAAYADAAYAADAAADAAAYAADADAAYAARQNAYIKFADKLLELLRDCK